MIKKLAMFFQSHFHLGVILVVIVLLTSSGAAAYALLRHFSGQPIIPIGHDTAPVNTTQPSPQNSPQKKPAAKQPAKKPETKPAAPAGNTPSQNNAPSQPGTPGNSATQKNCINKPSACGYPDALTTGYKHTGVTLTTNGININDEGDFIIEDDNTVIDSKRIDGCVIVRAKNVTIRRSLITSCSAYYNIWMQELPGGGIRDTSNFLMEDVEVDGNRVFTNAALVDDNGKGMTIRRMDMHDVADGPHPGENWLIEDSYIHDMYVCANECHTDSIQSAGAINVTLRHNTILNNPDNNGTGGKNAVVRIATEQGPVSGFVVDNNLLDGGNYAVQVRSQGNGAPSGVVVTNNRIVPTWRFAPYDFTGISVVLSGNYRDDTLEALNTPM